MVLDDEDAVAERDELLEDVEEFANVIEVQAGGRFVEDVERAAGLALGKLAGQLDALRFAAGKCGGRLAELNVAEADFDEGGKFLLTLRQFFEELERVGRRQIENIADGVAFVALGERFRIVAEAGEDFAKSVKVGEEIHRDAAQAVALAGFASAAFYVEAEAAGAVAAFARFGKHRKKLADGREDSRIRGGIRTRSAADGRLINFDDLVDLIGADDFAMRAGRFLGAIEFLREGAVENVVDERGFAGAGDTGDDGEEAEGQRDIEILQIVCSGAEDLNCFAVEAAALFRNGNARGSAEVAPGEGFRAGSDLFGLALRDEVAAGIARTGTEINNKIGATDGVFVVLDDEHGVAQVAKLFEGAEEAAVVARVQADGRLVENVEDTAQPRADLRGEADALGFAAGKGGVGAVQAEIPKADREKKIEALGDFFERAGGDFRLARRELRENLADSGTRGAEG